MSSTPLREVRILFLKKFSAPTLLMLAACSPEAPEYEPATVVRSSLLEIAPDLIGTYDDRLSRIAEFAPGFGGFYFSEGVPIAVVTSSADRDRVREALRSLLDERRERLGESAVAEDIKFVQGEFGFDDLVRWRVSLREVLAIAGVEHIDSSEKDNAVVIGVSSDESANPIEALIASTGVPRSAVLIRDTFPAMPLATLQDRVRPAAGGLQLTMGNGNKCTMSFSVRYTVNTQYDRFGFLTNSHCGAQIGATAETVADQPGWQWPMYNNLGPEWNDPPWLPAPASPSCPSGRYCRESDTALFDYTTDSEGVLVKIKNTSPCSPGPCTLAISTPDRTIVGLGMAGSVGDGVTYYKTGRTTGTTSGQLAGACVDANQAGTTRTVFCDYVVGSSISEGGDSGSPVFSSVPTGWLLQGVLWGGNHDPKGLLSDSYWIFSPLGDITGELGALQFY